MKPKAKSWLTTAIAIVFIVVLLVGIKAEQIHAMVRTGKSFVPPPEAVTSAEVRAMQWEVTTAAIGTLVAERAVTLGAELPGALRSIGFESGGSVKRGDVLVKLDTSAEEAQLASAQAEASLAKIDLDRVSALRRAGANAPADLDTAVARARQSSAAVANLRAIIAKKSIRAPFDGRISIRQVEIGQIVSPGTPIASLQSVSPIHADFWLPQQALAELAVGDRVRVSTDVAKDRRWEGEITIINPEVDAATRNVRVRATFANDDGYLRPGTFVKVEVVAPKRIARLIIPVTAVMFAPYGDSVFVLQGRGDGSFTAQQRFVHLGDRRGDLVAVEEGVAAGEIVASSGAFKLRTGARVTVNNALAPDAGATPPAIEP